MDYAYLPNGKTVVFDGENGKHSYYLEGEEVPSVTTINQAVGLYPTFPDLPEVRAAVDFGNLVHDEINQYEKTGKKGLTAEFRHWLEIRKIADTWETEVMFSTERFAGRVDAIGRCSDGSVVIVDHKTGSIPDNVAYQLSLYAKGLRECGIIPENAEIRLVCQRNKDE